MTLFGLNRCLGAQSEYFAFVNDQKFAAIDTFTLESGIELKQFNVAYKTWGTLNSDRDNCLVVCHALSGSSDVNDWWGPLLGHGNAFDSSRYFIFCANGLGSPYGSASPLSINPATGKLWGPHFPQTTIRDDVRVQKLILDALGVSSVAAVIGGSMGGMATLEWPLCSPKGYIKTIVPIATSTEHSAWGISWAEAQRHCIHGDPDFKNGHYIPSPSTQPMAGLSVARMIAMLTRILKPKGLATPPPELSSLCEASPEQGVTPPTVFSAQSYLQYQGQKFLRRFDANCYIHLTRKMDSHDITRGRAPSIEDVLGVVPPQALVIGIESDVLFTPAQQRALASALPDSRLVMVNSDEGHDGFLLAFDVLGPLTTDYLKEMFPGFYEGPPALATERWGGYRCKG